MFLLVVVCFQANKHCYWPKWFLCFFALSVRMKFFLQPEKVVFLRGKAFVVIELVVVLFVFDQRKKGFLFWRFF